jgi:hypothetical protein
VTTTGSSVPFKTIVKWLLSGILITLAIAFILLKSPALAPVVSIRTSHFPAMQSQLFYKNNDEYKEINSQISKLDLESQTLRFTLPLYDKNLRWDPLEKPGTFYVREVTVSVLAYTRQIALDDLTPLVQIEASDRATNFVKFTAPPGSTDPQINIQLNNTKLNKVRYLSAIFLGLVSALAILAWIKWHARILDFLQGERGYTARIRHLFIKENFSLSEFTKLLGVATFLNIIPIVNFFLSVDDERGAFRTDPVVWIADGRWTAFLVEKFIFPQPVMPFVPYLFFHACLALAYMFLIRAHRLTLNWITTLAYCILVAHPIWWFIGEFYSNIPSVGVGVLSLSIGIFALSQCRIGEDSNGNIWPLSMLSSVLLSLAIGAYQSLVMFYIVAGLGTVVMNFRKDNSTNVLLVKPTVQRITLLFATLVGGVLFYAIFNKLAQLAYPSDRSYIDNFLRINELIADPGLITKLVLIEAWKLYSGSSLSYGVSFFSAAIVLAFAILFLLTQNTWKASLWMAFLVGALLISPLLLNFVAGGIYLPLRAMLAISFVTWITTIIVLEKKGILRLVSTALAVALLFQMVSVNGQYSASTMMATTHDRLTAEALYDRISRVNPNFDKNEHITIDIYGRLPFASHYPAPETSTMSSSFFDWDQGNVYRMLEYMRLIGFSNVYAIGNAARIPLTPYFDKMPVWPADGSVRYENGIYLVKLSEVADPTHAQYKRVESK